MNRDNLIIYLLQHYNEDYEFFVWSENDNQYIRVMLNEGKI